MIRTSTIAMLLTTGLAASAACAQFEISWYTVDGGGVSGSTDGQPGGFELSGTIGQPDAGGPLTGDDFELSGGFWFAADSGATIGACCIDGTCFELTAEECVAFICDVTALQPPTFAGCFGDADGNAVVNPGDRGVISANIGQTDFDLLCLYDLDGNGVINPGDRGIVSANIGLCAPLPDYQNGSGLNGGAADPRFGEASFIGVGTTCGTTVCP